ncbi:nucleotidyltransferase domain-containing protein [Kitasatospora fiedleri]|uniref:nucleotidyltransferase domain-containing protein n=1 Tax=Kitasatospora fiedleri TaxID=2991545 RepID=UPI00249C6457|nr:nucleotidyltransferase domain-containing protein [Kitasatospora fiedleri]
MNVLLSGIVGSTAYGLAHAGSDLDRLGLFAAPTTAFHGLHRPAESHVTTRPDRTLHEAAKWCRLALNGNPTATELVWLPEELYEVRTPLGEELIGLRTSFLSGPAVRGAYLGYADQQFRKLTTRDRTDPAGRARAAKHARHLVRLVRQGVALHETGHLEIRLPDPEQVRALGERYADRPEEAAPSSPTPRPASTAPASSPTPPTNAPSKPGSTASAPPTSPHPDPHDPPGNPLALPHRAPGRITPAGAVPRVHACRGPLAQLAELRTFNP